MNNRIWHRYHFIIDDKVKFIGLTTDLKRRESEHQLRWPDGHIKQIGKRVAIKTGKEWEAEECKKLRR